MPSTGPAAGGIPCCMAIGNKTLRRDRRQRTPTRGALPTGWRTPKSKRRCLCNLSAGQPDRLLLVQERNSANTPTVTSTRGRDLSGNLAGAGGIGELLARSHGYSGGNWSSHTAYHADGNGNVTALVNSAGALQASYRYDPYGRYLAGGGTLAGANGLRFSSKPWVGFAGSTTSGLHYYGYRFYDPYMQRWVNRDPKGERGDRNLYRFTVNSPYQFLDPYGLDLVSIPGGPPITPFPPIPRPRPQPLPAPPPPPGVNVPPPCAPYPECLKQPPEEPGTTFEDCWRSCMAKMTFGHPVEYAIASGASGLARLVLAAAEYSGKVCPFLLGVLPAWGGGAAIGCAVGCQQGLGR
jgi:RHS repeat-associated protein